MKPVWQIKKSPADRINLLMRVFRFSPAAATVLANRQTGSMRDIHAFLTPSLKTMRPPDVLSDINPATNRTIRAIMSNETIVVFGDYDADGVTSTALLTRFLKEAGANVFHYIPHRVNEGYGLKEPHIQILKNSFNPGLIITVDNGSASQQAIRLAKHSYGIDTIITDHHRVPVPPPDAVAVVNPKRQDCQSGMAFLAGVGVAFYFIIALRAALRKAGHWEKKPEPALLPYTDLVALGTLADLVPLVGENRIFVQAGIKQINQAPRPGVAALSAAAGNGQNPVSSESIAFRLVPRINAAGRMAHADIGMSLLTAESQDESRVVASQLHNLNTSRQGIENDIFLSADHMIQTYDGLKNMPAIVLADPTWHLGVLGIVASKLVRKYAKPTILIAMSGNSGKGSARSVEGVDLYESLSQCEHLLEGYGGHTMAAGLSVSKSKLEQFKSTFQTVVAEKKGSNIFEPTLTLDYEIGFDEIHNVLLEELDRLSPFGPGNPEPLFFTKNVAVVHSHSLGKLHKKLVLTQLYGKSRQTIAAMMFNIDPDQVFPDRFDQIAFYIRPQYVKRSKGPLLVIESFN